MSNIINAAREAVQEMKQQARHVELVMGRNAASTLWATIEGLQRAILEASIMELAENGLIAVIESGRDCDGVEYEGSVYVIEASVDAYEALDDDIGKWADGPYRLQIARPSDAESVEYTSRDLVMEAHEDGHRHSIVSRFP